MTFLSHNSQFMLRKADTGTQGRNCGGMPYCPAPHELPIMLPYTTKHQYHQQISLVKVHQQII